MAQTDSIRLMIVAIRSRQDTMTLAAETLNKMFEKEITDLVAQVNRVRYCRFSVTFIDICKAVLVILIMQIAKKSMS